MALLSYVTILRLYTILLPTISLPCSRIGTMWDASLLIYFATWMILLFIPWVCVCVNSSSSFYSTYTMINHLRTFSCCLDSWRLRCLFSCAHINSRHIIHCVILSCVINYHVTLFSPITLMLLITVKRLPQISIRWTYPKIKLGTIPSQPLNIN